MRNLAVVYACTPSLGYAWNLGSFLGLSLVVQVVTGLLLLLNYNSLERFEAIQFILYEVQLGWLMKIVHSNNASMIFILLYLHLYKNLAVSGYRLRGAWNSGITMMLLIIGAAFTGYVLVGSQVWSWVTRLITRLLRVVPLVGERVLYSVWGGYRIRWVIYQTMLVVHFILPFIVLGMLVIHLNFLHYTGSTGSSPTHSSLGKVTFYPYYWGNNATNLVVYLVALLRMAARGGLLVFFTLHLTLMGWNVEVGEAFNLALRAWCSLFRGVVRVLPLPFTRSHLVGEDGYLNTNPITYGIILYGHLAAIPRQVEMGLPYHSADLREAIEKLGYVPLLNIHQCRPSWWRSKQGKAHSLHREASRVLSGGAYRYQLFVSSRSAFDTWAKSKHGRRLGGYLKVHAHYLRTNSLLPVAGVSYCMIATFHQAGTGHAGQPLV